MYECPALDWNLRVQYLNPTKNLTHLSGLDMENSSMREAAIQMDPREIQIIQEQSIPFPVPLNLWMYREEMKRRVSKALKVQKQKMQRKK